MITKIKCTGSADTALALVKEDLKQLGWITLIVLIHGPGFVDPQSEAHGIAMATSPAAVPRRTSGRHAADSSKQPNSTSPAQSV